MKKKEYRIKQCSLRKSTLRFCRREKKKKRDKEAYFEINAFCMVFLF